MLMSVFLFALGSSVFAGPANRQKPDLSAAPGRLGEQDRKDGAPTKLAAREFDNVLQQLPGGTMDWTSLRLRVDSRSDHQVGAWKDRRIQEQDALDSIAPTVERLLKRILVTADRTAGDLMEASGAMGAGLSERAHDWQVVETRYHDDGGVEMSAELDVRAWLQPALTELTAGPAPDTDPEGPTGVLIDARGLPFVPGLVPTVQTDDGRTLVQVSTFAREVGRREAPVVYVTDPADPRAARRIGDHPIMGRATEAAGAVLIVAPTSPLASTPQLPVLVANRRIVVVVDSQ